MFSYTSPMKSFERYGKISSLETVLRLQGLFRLRLQPLGLSPLQASMLLYLDRHPQCEMCEIASALCLPKVSAVETVQRIQRNGWILKPRVSAKKKTVKLQLTPQGTALVQKVKENIGVIDKLFALADNRTAA
jgi:DNA-binding MarR family transcriptional regulator